MKDVLKTHSEKKFEGQFVNK